MGLKPVLYDWGKLNETLFTAINSNYNGISDRIAIFFNHCGEYHNFPYIILGLVVCAMLDYGVRKAGNHSGMHQCLVGWLVALSTIVAAFAAYGLLLGHIKDFYGYPRPYVILNPVNVHLLELKPGEDAYRSFPSGHAVFITLLVTGLWRILSEGLRWLAVFLVIGVMWARIASGMHFPADVMGGMILGLVFARFARSIVTSILRRTGLRC